MCGLVVVDVVLVFYGPLTLFRSFRFRARSVNLSTLFLDKPPRQSTWSAHSFAINWQQPFLNQRKWENGRRNYFMTDLHERMLPDVRIEIATFRIPGGRASDRATTPGVRFSKNTLKFTKPNTTNAPNRAPCFLSTNIHSLLESLDHKKSPILQTGRMNKEYIFVISWVFTGAILKFALLSPLLFC